MPIATAAAAATATATATALVKLVLDDLYKAIKTAGVNRLGKSRSDLKDKTIARAIGQITKVKTLWNITKEVQLEEFYFPSSIIFVDEIRKKVHSLRDFGSVQNFVIQGTAGQGKSIFLRYLCGKELQQANEDSRVPLFVELRRIRSDAPLGQLILDCLTKYRLPSTPDAWDYLAQSGRFLLLLDAFDEIDPLLVDRTLAEIEHHADLYGQSLQIIVTSRPDADIQKSSRFRVAKLAPLTASDHTPFLTKICASSEQVESLSKAISGSPTDISELLTTPLMMTLLVILYQATHSIPDTLPRFYEELFDVLFYRHDHSKPGFRRKRHTDLDDSTIKTIFAAFCFFVRFEGLSTLTTEQFRRSVSKASAACNRTVDADKFRDELTKTICVMQQDGFDLSFIHKSVAQYYASTFVAGSSEEFAARFYGIALDDLEGGRWDLELKFLAEIDSYRFAKLYEMPLLKNVAGLISYSFDTADLMAKERLHNHLQKRYSLVWQRDESDEVEGDWQKPPAGWRRPVDGDPVAFVLGTAWIREIWIGSREPSLTQELFEKIGSRLKTDRHTFDTPVQTVLHLIKKHLPNVGSQTLGVLQARYERAAMVVRTEEQKTSMLDALMGKKPGG